MSNRLHTSSIAGKRSNINKCQNKNYNYSCNTIQGNTNIYGKTKFLKQILRSNVDLQLNTNIARQLNRLLTMFSLGQYELLEQEYNNKQFIDISELIDKVNINTMFGSAMKILYGSALNGLSRALIQYNQYINALITIETLNQKVEILDDPDKLNDYIEQMNRNVRDIELFDINPIQSIAPLLKPEYAEYVLRYGIPDDGLFDSDKLYQIMVELGLVDDL